jgi:hypothetical protein
MEESAAGGGAYLVLYLVLAGVGCFGMLLLAYNAWMAITHLRMEYEESASPMSLVAWVLSLVSLFLGPCGMLICFVTFIMARLESSKIYSGETPPASAIPCAVASFNSVMVILINLVLMTVLCVVQFL